MFTPTEIQIDNKILKILELIYPLYINNLITNVYIIGSVAEGIANEEFPIELILQSPLVIQPTSRVFPGSHDHTIDKIATYLKNIMRAKFYRIKLNEEEDEEEYSEEDEDWIMEYNKEYFYTQIFDKYIPEKDKPKMMIPRSLCIKLRYVFLKYKILHIKYQILHLNSKILLENIMTGSLKDLQKMIAKGFEEERKNVPIIIDKSNKMLAETRDSVEMCDPKSVSKIFDTSMYIKKYADDMLKEYFEFSSELSTLKKKFEDECVCNKKLSN